VDSMNLVGQGKKTEGKGSESLKKKQNEKNREVDPRGGLKRGGVKGRGKLLQGGGELTAA